MKRTVLKPVSKKMKAEKNRYMKIKKDYLENHLYCELCNIAKATQIHHKKGRGSLLCAKEYFMACCDFCHGWIHSHPVESYEQGWMIKRY